ncbi:hypothetical protein PCL_09350 [Purpureocillium lilacinum]|uniref:Uncharacterized protein n=1 Tax=Purpureocillium lilacinum TaxID=33203 RepID=A0A2U3EHS7_PURLI|nr:hypothetical protein PCL_09350 [Purpureocillium lilacinum]
MGPQFRPWVGANSEGRMDGRMGGSSACVSPAKQGLGGGRDALGIVIVSYVSCAGQQTTIDHGSSATDDWRRHQEPRTNRQASKRSVLAGERRRRQRDMVSLNAVGSALAHIPRFGIRIPEQAWLSAAGVRILSQAKPASVSQSVSQPAQTERNEPLLPSAAPPNSNVSGSQPGARLSTTCLRLVASCWTKSGAEVVGVGAFCRPMVAAAPHRARASLHENAACAACTGAGGVAAGQGASSAAAWRTRLASFFLPPARHPVSSSTAKSKQAIGDSAGAREGERRLKSLARQGVRPDKTRPSSSSSMTKGRRTATDDDDDDAIPRDANAMEHVAAGPPPTREREQRSRGLPSAVLGLKGKPLNEGKVSSVVQTLIVPGAVPACGHPTVVKGPWIRRYVRVGSPLVFRMPCAMPFRVSSLRYPAENDGSCTSTRIPSDCCLPQDDARGMVRREHGGEPSPIAQGDAKPQRGLAALRRGPHLDVQRGPSIPPDNWIWRPSGGAAAHGSGPKESRGPRAMEACCWLGLGFHAVPQHSNMPSRLLRRRRRRGGWVRRVRCRLLAVTATAAAASRPPGTTHSSVSMRWEGGNPRVARQGLGCRMCRHLPLLRGRTFLSDTRKQTSAGGEGLQAVTERRPSCCVRVQMRASRRCSGRGALFWQALASVGGGAGTLALGLVAGGLGSGPLCVPLMVVAATIDDAGIDLCPSSPYASSSSCPRFVRRCSSLPSLVCARAPALRIGEAAGGQPPATASPPTATTKVPKAAHLASIRQPPFNPLCSELHAHAHALVLAGLLCGRATTTLMLCVNVCLNIQSGSLLPKAHSSSKVELVPGHFHEAQPLGADLASLPRAPLSVDSRGWRTTRGGTLTAAGIFRGHRREQTKLSSDSRSGVFSCDEMTAALAFSWHGMASDAFPTSPNAAEPRPGPQKRHEPTNSRDGKSSTALVIGPSPAGGSLQVLAPVSWRVRLPSKRERSQAGWQGRGSSGSGSGFSLSHPPHLTVGLASCHRESSSVLPCGYRRGRDPELRSHAQWPWADFWQFSFTGRWVMLDTLRRPTQTDDDAALTTGDVGTKFSALSACAGAVQLHSSARQAWAPRQRYPDGQRAHTLSATTARLFRTPRAAVAGPDQRAMEAERERKKKKKKGHTGAAASGSQPAHQCCCTTWGPAAGHGMPWMGAREGGLWARPIHAAALRVTPHPQRYLHATGLTPGQVHTHPFPSSPPLPTAVTASQSRVGACLAGPLLGCWAGPRPATAVAGFALRVRSSASTRSSRQSRAPSPSHLIPGLMDVPSSAASLGSGHPAQRAHHRGARPLARSLAPPDGNIHMHLAALFLDPDLNLLALQPHLGLSTLPSQIFNSPFLTFPFPSLHSFCRRTSEQLVLCSAVPVTPPTCSTLPVIWQPLETTSVPLSLALTHRLDITHPTPAGCLALRNPLVQSCLLSSSDGQRFIYGQPSSSTDFLPSTQPTSSANAFPFINSDQPFAQRNGFRSLDTPVLPRLRQAGAERRGLLLRGLPSRRPGEDVDAEFPGQLAWLLPSQLRLPLVYARAHHVREVNTTGSLPVTALRLPEPPAVRHRSRRPWLSEQVRLRRSLHHDVVIGFEPQPLELPHQPLLHAEHILVVHGRVPPVGSIEARAQGLCHLLRASPVTTEAILLDDLPV